MLGQPDHCYPCAGISHGQDSAVTGKILEVSGVGIPAKINPAKDVAMREKIISALTKQVQASRDEGKYTFIKSDQQLMDQAVEDFQTVIARLKEERVISDEAMQSMMPQRSDVAMLLNDNTDETVADAMAEVHDFPDIKDMIKILEERLVKSGRKDFDIKEVGSEDESTYGSRKWWGHVIPPTVRDNYSKEELAGIVEGATHTVFGYFGKQKMIYLKMDNDHIYYIVPGYKIPIAIRPFNPRENVLQDLRPQVKAFTFNLIEKYLHGVYPTMADALNGVSSKVRLRFMGLFVIARVSVDNDSYPLVKDQDFQNFLLGQGHDLGQEVAKKLVSDSIDHEKAVRIVSEAKRMMEESIRNYTVSLIRDIIIMEFDHQGSSPDRIVQEVSIRFKEHDLGINLLKAVAMNEKLPGQVQVLTSAEPMTVADAKLQVQRKISMLFRVEVMGLPAPIFFSINTNNPLQKAVQPPVTNDEQELFDLAGRLAGKRTKIRAGLGIDIASRMRDLITRDTYGGNKIELYWEGPEPGKIILSMPALKIMYRNLQGISPRLARLLVYELNEVGDDAIGQEAMERMRKSKDELFRQVIDKLDGLRPGEYQVRFSLKTLSPLYTQGDILPTGINLQGPPIGTVDLQNTDGSTDRYQPGHLKLMIADKLDEDPVLARKFISSILGISKKDRVRAAEARIQRLAGQDKDLLAHLQGVALKLIGRASPLLINSHVGSRVNRYLVIFQINRPKGQVAFVKNNGNQLSFEATDQDDFILMFADLLERSKAILRDFLNELDRSLGRSDGAMQSTMPQRSDAAMLLNDDVDKEVLKAIQGTYTLPIEDMASQLKRRLSIRKNVHVQIVQYRKRKSLKDEKWGIVMSSVRANELNAQERDNIRMAHRTIMGELGQRSMVFVQPDKNHQYYTVPGLKIPLALRPFTPRERILHDLKEQFGPEGLTPETLDLIDGFISRKYSMAAALEKVGPEHRLYFKSLLAITRVSLEHDTYPLVMHFQDFLMGQGEQGFEEIVHSLLEVNRGYIEPPEAREIIREAQRLMSVQAIYVLDHQTLTQNDFQKDIEIEPNRQDIRILGLRGEKIFMSAGDFRFMFKPKKQNTKLEISLVDENGAEQFIGYIEALSQPRKMGVGHKNFYMSYDGSSITIARTQLRLSVMVLSPDRAMLVPVIENAITATDPIFHLPEYQPIPLGPGKPVTLPLGVSGTNEDSYLVLFDDKPPVPFSLLTVPGGYYHPVVPRRKHEEDSLLINRRKPWNGPVLLSDGRNDPFAILNPASNGFELKWIDKNKFSTSAHLERKDVRLGKRLLAGETFRFWTNDAIRIPLQSLSGKVIKINPVKHAPFKPVEISMEAGKLKFKSEKGKFQTTDHYFVNEGGVKLFKCEVLNGELVLLRDDKTHFSTVEISMTDAAMQAQGAVVRKITPISQSDLQESGLDRDSARLLLRLGIRSRKQLDGLKLGELNILMKQKGIPAAIRFRLMGEITTVLSGGIQKLNRTVRQKPAQMVVVNSNGLAVQFKPFLDGKTFDEILQADTAVKVRAILNQWRNTGMADHVFREAMEGYGRLQRDDIIHIWDELLREGSFLGSPRDYLKRVLNFKVFISRIKKEPAFLERYLKDVNEDSSEENQKLKAFIYFTIVHLFGFSDEAMTLDVAVEKLRAGKILIVDDNLRLGRARKVLLESFGINCEIAGNGAEALALLNSGEKFVFVLSDLQMPGMDGEELVKRIRQSGTSYANIKMLIQTGSLRPNTERMAEGSNVRVISMAIDPEELIITIASELDKALTVRGGIDLSRSQLHVSKEGAGVQMPFDQAMVARIRREGFDGIDFQIKSIVAVADLPALLGVR
jgi:CheY-like chemotaxis protein